jgi:hypothetical protein
MASSSRLAFSVDPETHQRLRNEAARMKCSVGLLVRSLTGFALERLEAQEKQVEDVVKNEVLATKKRRSEIGRSAMATRYEEEKKRKRGNSNEHSE